MSNGIKAKFLLSSVMLSVGALAGCDGQRVFQEHPAENLSAEVLSAWHEGELPILRMQVDAARRGWILTPKGVIVFDFKSRKTVGAIPLPAWVWAGEPFGCTPDL